MRPEVFNLPIVVWTISTPALAYSAGLPKECSVRLPVAGLGWSIPTFLAPGTLPLSEIGAWQPLIRSDMEREAKAKTRSIGAYRNISGLT